MPPCPSRGGGRRGGTSFGTSLSSRGDTDSTLRTALLSGLKLFGEKYDFELLAKHDESGGLLYGCLIRRGRLLGLLQVPGGIMIGLRLQL
ncbi:hypothetical protein LOK49_LG09G00147 [Camellia lanceoleosa]|uniref:Uncharacterized protein n=1 Tax=Camellia lanceoleosa TaxID=1840588 RepID=A0ACC0GKN6_9ERIC|nr:hypothetical protein LOK49_LG09G00147 [Camellia lanceoleosa]